MIERKGERERGGVNAGMQCRGNAIENLRKQKKPSSEAVHFSQLRKSTLQKCGSAD
jgi:hypothetical protein